MAAKSEYDFTKLERYLEREFLEPDECIQQLEEIEEALQDLEKLFILNPAIAKALVVHRNIIEHIYNSIPDSKRRNFRN
jgi:hypothetical protein